MMKDISEKIENESNMKEEMKQMRICIEDEERVS